MSDRIKSASTCEREKWICHRVEWNEAFGVVLSFPHSLVVKKRDVEKLNFVSRCCFPLKTLHFAASSVGLFWDTNQSALFGVTTDGMHRRKLPFGPAIGLSFVLSGCVHNAGPLSDRGSFRLHKDWSNRLQNIFTHPSVIVSSEQRTPG